MKNYFCFAEENEYGWCKDAQLQTLATLYDVIICVLSVGKNQRNQTTIQVKYYGENPSSEKKKNFIYMLYEKISLKYYGLRATNQVDPTEEITQFIHNDTVKNLLGVLFREDFHCEYQFKTIGKQGSNLFRFS